MINRDEANKGIILINEKIEIGFSYDKGFRINRLVHKSIHRDSVLNNMQEELFVLVIEGRKYMSSLFEVMEISDVRDKTEEMASVLLIDRKAGILSKVCFINNPDNTINLVVQLAVQWEDGYPEEVYMHIPFLANFSLGNGKEEEYYLPGNTRSKADGSNIMQLNGAMNLPLGIFEKSSGKGICIEFPVADNHVGHWDQNRSHEFSRIGSIEQIRSHNLLLRPNHVLTDIFEMKLTAIDTGWPECFTLWRERVRKTIYPEQYERDDLKWYKDTFLHHFTFIYGKEAYNYETNVVEISRLLEQGEDFGGYDAIILWHQYPRLGVDQRNQWDFFNEFPGGKDCIGKIVEKAHNQGTKVFLPFKPWDVGKGESPVSVMDQMAELIKDTDVDGIFFDTMNSVPEGFRKTIDSIRPGVVFCTEHQPRTRDTLELITGSWDQYGSRIPIPETNLLRFVLPEHFSPIISRWDVGIKKDMLIKRAIFNGTGIVIWQDVFGSWQPYSKEQKEKIKKWKSIFKDNKDIYSGKNPIPLYPVIHKGLFCNYFLSDSKESMIYTIYNETCELICGDLFVNRTTGITNVMELWKDAAVERKDGSEGEIICSCVDAGDLLIIKFTK